MNSMPKVQRRRPFYGILSHRRKVIYNKTGDARMTYSGALLQPLLQWQTNNYYIVCVCVFVCIALLIQHTTRKRHIVICGLLRSTILFHIISKRGMAFEKKKSYRTQNVCFEFPYKFFRKVSHSKKN